MNRFLILLLVFVLSGVPAAAVVCDLVLCTDSAKAAAASTGCHDHAAPQSGERMTARVYECTHISPAEPYVASAWRFVLHTETAAPVASMTHLPVMARGNVDARSAHGPPNLSRVGSLPLRI